MRFLVKSFFKEPPAEEVLALIPPEQAKVKELLEQGALEALYVAADNSAAWMVWNCETQDAFDQGLESLPLHDYLNFEITLLAEAS